MSKSGDEICNSRMMVCACVFVCVFVYVCVCVCHVRVCLHIEEASSALT
jgi:hypothetical protein